ncbi:hypothetical protein MPTK1_4g21115 [Marchantia polymorpha subsp. ruderalis]
MGGAVEALGRPAEKVVRHALRHSAYLFPLHGLLIQQPYAHGQNMVSDGLAHDHDAPFATDQVPELTVARQPARLHLHPHLLLQIVSEQRTIVPARSETIQIAIGEGNVARDLLASGKAAHSSPGASGGVKNFGGQQPSHDDFVAEGTPLGHHAHEDGPLLARHRGQLPPALGQGIAHKQRAEIIDIAVEFVDQAQQSPGRGHREACMRGQEADGDVVPLAEHRVVAGQQSAVLAVGDLHEIRPLGRHLRAHLEEAGRVHDGAPFLTHRPKPEKAGHGQPGQDSVHQIFGQLTPQPLVHHEIAAIVIVRGRAGVAGVGTTTTTRIESLLLLLLLLPCVGGACWIARILLPLDEHSSASFGIILQHRV